MGNEKWYNETPQNPPLRKGAVSNRLYIWAIIENIVTILVTAGLFWLTKSGWCFLFLLNINSIKTNFKRKS